MCLRMSASYLTSCYSSARLCCTVFMLASSEMSSDFSGWKLLPNSVRERPTSGSPPLRIFLSLLKPLSNQRQLSYLSNNSKTVIGSWLTPCRTWLLSAPVMSCAERSCHVSLENQLANWGCRLYLHAINYHRRFPRDRFWSTKAPRWSCECFGLG